MHLKRLTRFPWLVARKFQSFNPLLDIGQCDPGLQACQGRAQARVDAMPKRNVRIGVAGYVKTAGIGELLGITVRGSDHWEDELARRDHLAVQLAS